MTETVPAGRDRNGPPTASHRETLEQGCRAERAHQKDEGALEGSDVQKPHTFGCRDVENTVWSHESFLTTPVGESMPGIHK